MSQRKPAGTVEVKRFSGTSKYVEIRIYSGNNRARRFLRYASLGAGGGLFRAFLSSSPSTSWVLAQVAAGAAFGLLLAVFTGKTYPEKDPDTPEIISARALCGVCGHPQAFHERKVL
jgi:hypothetical protein